MIRSTVFIVQLDVKHFGPILRVFSACPSLDQVRGSVNEFFSECKPNNLIRKKFHTAALKQLDKQGFSSTEHPLFSI